MHLNILVIVGAVIILVGILILINAFSDHDIDLDDAGPYEERANQILARVERRIAGGHATAADYYRRGRIRQIAVLNNEIQDQTTINELTVDYDTALDQAILNEVITDTIIAGVAQFIGVQRPAMGNIAINNLTNTMTHVNKQTAENRIEHAEEVTENRLDAVNLAITEAAATRSDSQNVHDTAVNNNLRQTIQLLKSSAEANVDYNELESIHEAATYVRAHGTNNANRVLEIMLQGGIVHTFGINEREILSLVWERTKAPENSNVSEGLREALLDALNDAVEHGQPVCANGRSARVLGSGVTIDSDSRIGALNTTQDIRREIFNEIKKMFDDTIASAAIQDSDNDLKTLGEVYLGKSDREINPTTEQRLQEQLKTELRAIVDKYPTLTPTDRSRTIDEAEIYLGID
jgi:hypothetical protein